MHVFVDADFDENSELTELTDVYVTPCYSIENLYVAVIHCRRILSAEFNLTDCHEDADCYDSVIREFENILSRFVDLIVPFNALIRELRIMESNGDLEGRLNINNLKFDELIDVDISGSPSLIKNTMKSDLIQSFQSWRKIYRLTLVLRSSIFRRARVCNGFEESKI